MDLSRLEWLELQSKSKPYQVKIFEEEKIQPKSKATKTTVFKVWENSLPNYIDPSTGMPYDPFRENGARGRKLDKLRKLRAVLP